MPPASLTTFPAELLIQVYKSLDNVKDVTALNLASHQFYDLWVSHTVSISDAVFSRTIKSFDDARELVKIQQKFVERNHCDDGLHQDHYRQALERNKLMVSNDHGFRAFYQEEKDWHSADENLMSKTYYCVGMLVLVKEDAFAQSSCLASLSRKTLQSMYGIIIKVSFVLSFEAEDDDGLSVPIPPGIGLREFGQESRQHSLVNVQETLQKRIWALKKAEKVGNGVGKV